jgi:hypothetical protein
VTAKGEELLAAGTALYLKARDDLKARGPSPSMEQVLRRAHAVLRSAMDWLEGSALFDDAHRMLDEAGALARDVVPGGCHLVYESSTYYQDCPVALAHDRVAFSPEMLIRQADCSICQADYRNCDHVPGVTYAGQECHRIIKDFDILDIMLVARPANPETRVHRISIETAKLRNSLGPDFSPGMPVLCDRCLSPCGGVAQKLDQR